MSGIRNIVLDSFWMIVNVEHVTRLVLHVHNLVTYNKQHFASSVLGTSSLGLLVMYETYSIQHCS